MTVIRVHWDIYFMVNHSRIGPVFSNVLNLMLQNKNNRLFFLLAKL